MEFFVVKCCVALFVVLFVSPFTFAETLSFSIDEASTLQYWPPFGFPLEGCGDLGTGPCEFGIAGTFDFTTDEETIRQRFFNVDVSISGDDDLLLSARHVGPLAAAWMSDLPFWPDGEGRFSSVGTVEVNFSSKGLSLTGLQDARPGDGNAFMFNVHASEIPEPRSSWFIWTIMIALALKDCTCWTGSPTGRGGKARHRWQFKCPKFGKLNPWGNAVGVTTSVTSTPSVRRSI